MSRSQRNLVEKFLRDPKQMLFVTLLLVAISASFLRGVWEADSWQQTVIWLVTAILTIYAASRLIPRIETYFSPRPVLWLGRRERDLLSLIANNKACGAPYLRDGKLYVCQVPPHTDRVNHIGLYMMEVSEQNASVDLTVDGDGKLDVIAEEDQR